MAVANSAKRRREAEEEPMPALFLSAPPAGTHADCDALAALIDGDDEEEGEGSHQCEQGPRSAQRKRFRSVGLGRVQVDLALTGLESGEAVEPRAGGGSADDVVHRPSEPPTVAHQPPSTGGVEAAVAADGHNLL